MLSTTIKETNFAVGDTIRVHTQVVEGGRSRVQIFPGLVIRIQGRGENATFTVRRIGAAKIGVERTWPINSRGIVKVEVTRKANKVRRSKLYFLRDLTGKSATRV